MTRSSPFRVRDAPAGPDRLNLQGTVTDRERAPALLFDDFTQLGDFCS
ncbi:hypothetical protein ACFY64_13650 [Streptomyces collinus]